MGRCGVKNGHQTNCIYVNEIDIYVHNMLSIVGLLLLVNMIVRIYAITLITKLIWISIRYQGQDSCDMRQE